MITWEKSVIEKKLLLPYIGVYTRWGEGCGSSRYFELYYNCQFVDLDRSLDTSLAYNELKIIVIINFIISIKDVK